jgi:hypothetical protein
MQVLAPLEMIVFLPIVTRIAAHAFPIRNLRDAASPRAAAYDISKTTPCNSKETEMRDESDTARKQGTANQLTSADTAVTYLFAGNVELRPFEIKLLTLR